MHGFHEVDLMNADVSQLLLHSHDPWTALALGWHPWSLCRGVGYMFVIFEVSSLSLSWLLGVSLSTPAGAGPLAGRPGFLLADGILKYHMLEFVRQTLQENLI